MGCFIRYIAVLFFIRDQIGFWEKVVLSSQNRGTLLVTKKKLVGIASIVTRVVFFFFFFFLREALRLRRGESSKWLRFSGQTVLTPVELLKQARNYRLVEHTVISTSALEVFALGLLLYY